MRYLNLNKYAHMFIFYAISVQSADDVLFEGYSEKSMLLTFGKIAGIVLAVLLAIYFIYGLFVGEKKEKKSIFEKVYLHQIMNKAYQFAEPSFSANDVHVQFLKHKISHMSVVSDPENRKFLGIITRHDLMSKRGKGVLKGDGNVEDIMRKKVVTMSPYDSLRRCVSTLSRNGFGCLPVVAAENRLLGFVTRTDLVVALNKYFASTQIFKKVPIKRVMTAKVSTINHNETVDAASRIFTELGIGHMPIVGSGSNPLQGVIAKRDVEELVIHGKQDCTVGAEGTQSPHALEQTKTLHEAIQEFATGDYGCIPIIDDRKHVVGIVTRSDVLKAVTRYLFE